MIKGLEVMVVPLCIAIFQAYSMMMMITCFNARKVFILSGVFNFMEFVLGLFQNEGFYCGIPIIVVQAKGFILAYC